MPCSILDTDLYKLTMQQAILGIYPNVVAKYKFINRDNRYISDIVGEGLQLAINKISELKLSDNEAQWLSTLPYISPWYIEYLRNYRFNPDQVKITHDGWSIQVEIEGLWRDTVLWEVPLMAMISELYFKDKPINQEQLRNQTQRKAALLSGNDCYFSDFGTRRRRSVEVQDIVIQELMKYPTFVGTSNPYFAHKYKLTPIGTVAHEWIQAQSVLCGIKHANSFAMKSWLVSYQGQLGIALTDTYGLDAFFDDFDSLMARVYDGLRHDSGCPYEFVDQSCNHYKMLGINTIGKTLIFSDNLNPEKCVDIKRYCVANHINCSFGIGTNLTNDFEDEKALNMVIKLWSIDDMPVVKLGEGEGKECGEPEAIKLVKQILGM